MCYLVGINTCHKDTYCMFGLTFNSSFIVFQHNSAVKRRSYKM